MYFCVIFLHYIIFYLDICCHFSFILSLALSILVCISSMVSYIEHNLSFISDIISSLCLISNGKVSISCANLFLFCNTTFRLDLYSFISSSIFETSILVAILSKSINYYLLELISRTDSSIFLSSI